MSSGRVIIIVCVGAGAGGEVMFMACFVFVEGEIERGVCGGGTANHKCRLSFFEFIIIVYLHQIKKTD